MNGNAVGIAACTWGLEPGYDWVPRYDPEQVIATAAALGFAGIEPATENGPGELVKEQAAAVGLACPARFVGLPLADSDEATRVADAALSDLVDLGAGILLVGIESLGDTTPLARLARACGERGVVPALHPELGGPVATAAELEGLLKASDTLALCLDAGHLFAAGDVDVAALVSRWGDRIAHVHLKDVDAEFAAAVRRGELGLHEAVRAGLWRPLGEGGVPLIETLAALAESDYQGWLVVEDDFAADPERSAQTSLAWLSGR
jgi:inosose dehydratase